MMMKWVEKLPSWTDAAYTLNAFYVLTSYTLNASYMLTSYALNASYMLTFYTFTS